MITGTAIFTDLDKNTYAIIPAAIHAIAVRVPEGNIAHVHPKPVIRNRIRCFLILLVMAKIRKATAADAVPTPKLAASL